MVQALKTLPPADTRLSPLDALSSFFQDDMRAVNQEILDKLTSDVPLINQIATYLIASGGKRIRPMLTLAATSALGGDMTRAHGLAACVEFIHTATLLHDDVVDESHERRGQQTANDVFGNQASVLVGDYLFSRSFQLMVADGSLDTLKILSDASAVIAEGEVMQLQLQNDLATTWDQYIQMVGAKTAALFAAACEVGAVVSNAAPDARRAMYDYGYQLGVAFQIADDVLDYSAAAATLGKTPGDDFKEGKITAPVLLALAQADASEKAFWQRTIAEGRQNEQDLQQALDYMTIHNVMEQGLEKARSFAVAAQNALASVPDTDVKAMMIALCDYVVTREY